MSHIAIFIARFFVIIIIAVVSSNVYVHMKSYFKFPKKLWFLRYLKSLSVFRYMKKKRNASSESPLLSMCSDEYLNCLKNKNQCFYVKILCFTHSFIFYREGITVIIIIHKQLLFTKCCC